MEVTAELESNATYRMSGASAALPRQRSERGPLGSEATRYV